MQGAKNLHHARARFGVEAAGGLVGEQQARFADDGAGDRDALSLAARELPWMVAQAMPEAHAFERDLCAGTALACRHPGVKQPSCHVVERCHPVGEVKLLEDKSDCVGPKRREFGVVHAHHIVASNAGCTLGGAVERADDVEHGRLAAATGPDDREQFALVDGEVDAVQGHGGW